MLRDRNLEVMGLSETLVWHACERPKPALLELAVMAFRPDQREVPACVLRAELAIGCTVDHLRVVVVALGVYLV